MINVIEQIARVCHEASVEYCRTIGDNLQPHWSCAPAWQKESAMNGVQFHIANPGAGDSASHENWMKDKIKDGWTYGPKKDFDLKQHPCMVPFDQLPKDQQLKDRLFRSIVHALYPRDNAGAGI